VGYKDKPKQREYQRKWLAERRKFAIAVFGDKCTKCGSTTKLEFDHIDPKTKIHHSIWSWAPIRIKAELEKCQLLCAECHKDKTGRTTHGTDQMYKNYKCRCNLCKEGSARRKKKSRDKKRVNVFTPRKYEYD